MIKNTIRIIALIELAIGTITIFGLTGSALFCLSKKPPHVFIFVLVCAIISSVIGMGLVKYKEWARVLLVFFSGYIILTKVLIFLDLMHFNGEMMTLVPVGIKNLISITYHGFILLFFTRTAAKKHFLK